MGLFTGVHEKLTQSHRNRLILLCIALPFRLTSPWTLFLHSGQCERMSVHAFTAWQGAWLVLDHVSVQSHVLASAAGLCCCMITWQRRQRTLELTNGSKQAGGEDCPLMLYTCQLYPEYTKSRLLQEQIFLPEWVCLSVRMRIKLLQTSYNQIQLTF